MAEVRVARAPAGPVRPPSTAAAGYLLLQAGAVPAWWGALRCAPRVRALFELGDPAVLDSFVPGDVLLALASATAGTLAGTGRRGALPAAAATTALVAASTAATWWFVARSRQGALGALAMGTATAGSALALRALSRAGA